MAIQIGACALPEGSTVVREEYEVAGGRRTRVIRITGLLRSPAGGLGAAFDEVAQAVSEDMPVAVSLRAGRRLFARREALARELNERSGTGQFTLQLRAEDDWEESETQREASWSIALSGADIELENEGTMSVRPRITLAADDDLVNPTLSDGARTLTYHGTVPNGATLDVDGGAGRVLLDGDDVTPYTSGAFPEVAPGGATLVYTDDPASGHVALATVRHRDRWW